MAASTYTNPDNTAQSGATYKKNIDDGFDSGERVFNMFAPHAQATANMTVRVDAGHVWNGVALTEVAAASSATIVAPTTNPRRDRVVANRLTGALSVITGTEAASPVVPAITADKVPICWVALVVGQTTIVNADITDERDFAWLGDGRATLEAKTAAFTVATGDHGKVFNCTSGTFTVTLPAAATALAGFEVTVVNAGTGVVTLDGDGAETIDGATTLALQAAQSATLVSTGSAWRVKWAGNRTKGRHTLYILAESLRPHVTSGCAALAQYHNSNQSKPVLDYLAFDSTTAETSCLSLQLPKSWNVSTVKCQYVWLPANANAGAVLWAFGSVATSDGDSANALISGDVGVADTSLGADKVHVSPESAAHTIGGTPADGDLINFLIYRAPGDVSDTYGSDAWLVGVILHFDTDAETDD